MFDRFAIYYTAQGHFASHGAAWLGWDVEQGQPAAHPNISGLDVATLTQTPRKYGFHGTLKAPFRLAEGADAAGLKQATASLAGQLHSVSIETLKVTALGRFLALVPEGDDAAIKSLGAKVVRAMDPFRAEMSDDERTRRRAANLSAAQEDNLQRWGYPHVMDQFRFHMTLTSRLPRAKVTTIEKAVQAHFAPVLPKPFVLDALTLVGQRTDGRFVTIARFPLL